MMRQNWKFEVVDDNDMLHLRVQVRCGPKDTDQPLLGTLVMSEAQFHILRTMLEGMPGPREQASFEFVW